jgi:hypothetical protein
MRSNVSAAAQTSGSRHTKTPFRRSERTLGEYHVESSRFELLDQFRADADLHLELHSSMKRSDRARNLSAYVEFWLRFIGVREVVTLTLEHTWNGRAVDMIAAGKKESRRTGKAILTKDLGQCPLTAPT